MIDFLSTWGYLALFAVLFLENSALVGLVVPGITVLISAGFLAGAGQLSLALVMLIAWAGVFLGDLVCYLLGSTIVKKSRKLRQLTQQLDRATLSRWYVVFYQFPVVTRIAVPLIAGSLKLRGPRVWVIEGLATTIFVTALSLAGYFAGIGASSIATAEAIGENIQWIFLGVLLFWVIWISTMYVRRRKK